ncbi:hypothetical protein Tco_0589442, partial [Tanacetum coccineum]
ECNLGLLQDNDGKSNGDGVDDDDRNDGAKDDDGRNDSGDVRISFPDRRAKAGLVDKGRVGGEWITNVGAV